MGTGIIDYFGRFLSPSRPQIGFAIELIAIALIWFWWFRNKKRVRYNIRNRGEKTSYVR